MKLQLVENFAANIALGLRNYDHISEGLRFLGCFELKFNNCAIMYVIIQLLYTVRYPIFWLPDLYHVIVSCDETTTLTSLSWRNSRGVNSTHHCHYTMASADSKFDDLSDADIDSLIDDEILNNTKKATAWGISILKGKVANFKFLIQASWGVCVSTVLPALDNL